MPSRIHGFTEQSFRFLEELGQNNERDWFQANKAVFKTKLEDPFIDLLDDLSDRLSDADIPMRGSKKTMFRMNRDVRFSKDKRPYKEGVSGLLTRSGTKSEAGGLVYAEINASGGLAAAGYYKLAPKDLGPMRDKILEHDDAFERAIDALRDAGYALRTEDALASMPRGFAAHAQHRHAWALKLKSIVVMDAMPKSAWLKGDIADRVERLARATMPLMVFFDPA